ncbi:hypothetical protein Mapa_009710 [Marchantia paleacea]|nr:hypothetical protein Mapa_009710 [Marchantia paleacea]
MENNRSKVAGKDKKQKRKEELAKKKALDDLLKVAYAKENILAEFPAFLKYERNGLNLTIEYGTGETLSSSMKDYIMKLYTVNMMGPFGDEWPQEQKNKRREMVSQAARYIILRQTTGSQVDAKDEAQALESKSREQKQQSLWAGEGDPVVAFVQFRFMIDHDVPVLYVYELQLESCVQRKGLGKFLMQFCELIGRKNQMKGVMLTVQKKNIGAMNFYTSKLRYSISAVSPSKWDPMIGSDASYEILCKTFDAEAKAILEDGSLES